MVRTTLYLDYETKRKLKQYALDNDKSVNSIVEKLIVDLLAVKHDINKIKTDKFVGGNK